MTRVFISYTHDDNEHQTRVQALAARLRGDGVDVVLDQDQMPGGPDKGWETWSQQQAAHIERVLPVFTASYYQCWEGEHPPGMRTGATDEAFVIKHRISQAGAETAFCRPLVFDPADKQWIPERIAALHSYTLDQDYELLLAWLRGKPATQAAQAASAFTCPDPPPGYRWPLADRKNEFKRFDQMLRGAAPQRILLVKGGSGSGKSQLLESLEDYAAGLGLPVARPQFKGSQTLAEIFEQLRIPLRGVLPDSAFDPAAPSRLIEHLQTLKQPLALLFDVYEDATDEGRDWLERRLLHFLPHAPRVVVVVGGQKIPDKSKSSWRRFAVEHELSAIDRPDDWHHYTSTELGCTAISIEEIQLLLEGTRGNPGFMSAMLQNIARRRQAGAAL